MSYYKKFAIFIAAITSFTYLLILIGFLLRIHLLCGFPENAGTVSLSVDKNIRAFWEYVT